MKKLFPVCIAVAISLLSCSSNPGKMDDTKEMQLKETASTIANLKTITVAYPNIDPGVAAFVKAMVADYLVLKNALADDDGLVAASTSLKMKEAVKKLDESLFTTEQKKTYDAIEDGFREHTDIISKNGDNIKQQRDHFAMVSDDMYNLVKSFGAGITLYHDQCPMYNDGQGAWWLSETKEIRNPYYGKKMISCGSVVEMFKQSKS